MLKAMLNSGLTTADGSHLINDEKIKVEDFKQFLKFLYLDECDIHFTNLGALLHMGQIYFVPALKQKCMEFVKNECKTIEGNLKCCKIGILCSNECSEVLKFCIKELAQNYLGKNYQISAELVAPDGSVFSSTVELTKNELENDQISAELVERIAKDCPRDKYLTENELFVKIYDWGKAECTRRNLSVEKEAIKNVLSPILKHIHFKDVSLYSWLHYIKPNELLPLEECNKVIDDFARSCPQSALKLTPQMLKDGEEPLVQEVTAYLDR